MTWSLDVIRQMAKVTVASEDGKEELLLPCVVPGSYDFVSPTAHWETEPEFALPLLAQEAYSRLSELLQGEPG
jgi:hypothetical protein